MLNFLVLYSIHVAIFSARCCGMEYGDLSVLYIGIDGLLSSIFAIDIDIDSSFGKDK
jgi:hypothetical protein